MTKTIPLKIDTHKYYNLNSSPFLYLLLLIFTYSCKGNHQSNDMAQAENKVAKIDVVTDTFGLDYIMGKFDPAKHVDFVEIPKNYADREGRYMRKDAFDAFVKMYESALTQEINLKIISAARNFNYQKGIWERKWNGKTLLEGKTNATTIGDPSSRALKILEYSSMPGTSRHHWGTDIDLNSLNNQWFTEGKGKETYEWLIANGSKFGYCQVYTQKGESRPHGYNEEKWHWSFTPVSSVLTKEAELNLNNTAIGGFDGDVAASLIDVVAKYVLGISPKCR